VRRVYDLFVSGGRDSVVAATIGYERARREGVGARVVFIKEFELPEGIDIPDPEGYVRRFAEWLGVELVILKPKIEYWEGVKRWGYPLLFFHRWCFQKLKKEPLMEFLRTEYIVERVSPVWVVGVRRGLGLKVTLYHFPSSPHLLFPRFLMVSSFTAGALGGDPGSPASAFAFIVCRASPGQCGGYTPPSWNQPQYVLNSKLISIYVLPARRRSD